MADDITLTVRVRDMTARPLAQLSQRLRRMERDLRGRSGRDNMFDRLGQGIARFQTRLNTTHAFVGRFRRGLNSVVSSAATPLRRAMDGLGNATRNVFRLGERAVAGFRRSVSGAYGPLTRLAAAVWRVGRTFNNMLNTNQRWKAIIIASFILMGAAAQLLGALLVTALGGAFIALGAYALRGSAQVKSAFKDMKSSISSTLTEAAAPMESFLVAGINQVSNAVQQLKPALTAAFEATGPLIQDFFGAFTDFAASAMPGFIRTLQSSGPVMAGFRDGMSEIGKGIGDMFAEMNANGGAEALGDVWRTVGRELANLFTNIGKFINQAAKSGTATMILVGFFRALSGVLHVVEAGFEAVDLVFGSMFNHLNKNILGFGKLTGISDDFGASFVAAGQNVGELKKQLADTDKEIARIQKWRKEINDSYLSGPAKDLALDDRNAQDKDLKKAQEKRKALLAALSDAEKDAAAATKSHAQAVQDLIDKVRALNDLNRQNLDSRAAQEQAIDDAAKSYKKYAHALKMSNGSIADSLKNQSGRDAYELLSKIASSTNDATKAAQEAKQPWSDVQSIWKTGRDSLVNMADGMGLTKEQAQQLANQLLRMPSPSVTFEANTAEASANLQSFVSKVEATPGSKSVTLNALSAQAEAILTNFGYKVERLPNGKVTVTAATGTAATNIEYIRNILAGLDGTIARTYVETINTTIYQTDNRGKSLHEVVGATGGMASSLRRFASGGSISGGVLDGPGTKTSDSLTARLSRGEFVMRAAAVDKYGPHFMQMVNNGLYEKPPGFAKGGKVSQATKDARSSLAGSFGISALGRYAGYTRTPFERSLAVPDSLNSLVTSLNQAISNLKKAFSGSTEKRLVSQMNSSGRALIRQQKNLDKVNKSLEKAKDKLDDLKQSASQLKESVTSGVMSATAVTQVASGDNNVTIADVMKQMRTGVDQSTAFASALGQLKARGVNKDIIGQIADAGISGGGLETAGAILSASSSEIQTLNAMQAKITAAAGTAGKTASDAMYAAGIKAAEGMVAGLTKKQKAIENAMLKIARAMEKSIKHALGIKSPSKVMEKVGHFTAEGFAVGMKRNSSVDSAWESMLTTGPATGGTGASGGGVYTFPIYVGGKFLDEVVLDTNRRLVRTRGGNVQKVFGP